MNLVRVGFVRTRSLRGAVSRMQWPFFLGATLFAMTVSGQCIEGVPAAYPLGAQVALHILDPDCSFEAKWKKYIADPSVDSVGLIYHERISASAMVLMKSNPTAGQTVTVWGLDGQSSTVAQITTATDVGGDYSAYVLTIPAPNCNSARIGSIVTTSDSTEVAGFVRKAIDGPQCVLHVIKPSSMRSLLSVQPPVGAPFVKLNGGGGMLVPRKMVAWRESTTPSLPEPIEVKDFTLQQENDVLPIVFVVKNQKLSTWTTDLVGRLAKDLTEAWGAKRPAVRVEFPFRQSDAPDLSRAVLPSAQSSQVLIFLENSFTRQYYSIAVHHGGGVDTCAEKTETPPMAYKKSWKRFAQELVETISQGACFQKLNKARQRQTEN